MWYGCYNLGQLVVLSASMCGMPVPIRLTCGFERKYVWYGCYNLINLWFWARVYVVWLLQFGQLVVFSASMCGMPVIIRPTSGFERKYVWYVCYNLVNFWFWAQVCVVWLLQFGRLVILSLTMCGMGCYNLVNLWFWAQICVVWLLQFCQLVVLSASMCVYGRSN